MSDSAAGGTHDSAAASAAAAQADAALAKQLASGQWTTKRMQDEFDQARSNLVHRDFRPTDYPDPLRPRPSGKNPFAGKYPADAEQRLKKFVDMVDT